MPFQRPKFKTFPGGMPLESLANSCLRHLSVLPHWRSLRLTPRRPLPTPPTHTHIQKWNSATLVVK
jgi:hypothetical protein